MKLIKFTSFLLFLVMMLAVLILANCKSSSAPEPTAEAEAELSADLAAEVKSTTTLTVEANPEAEAKIVCSPVYTHESADPVDLEPVSESVKFLGICILLTATVLALMMAWISSWKREGTTTSIE